MIDWCLSPTWGPLMWIAGLCSQPPALAPMPLPAQGSMVERRIQIRSEGLYLWLLEFQFPSTEARVADRLVGSRSDPRCIDDPASLPDDPAFGVPLVLRLVLRRASDRSVLHDAVVPSRCGLGHADARRTRGVARQRLAPGAYVVEIAVQSVPAGLAGLPTTIALVPPGGK